MKKSEMLNAIKEYLNISTNKAFAEYLGIKPTTLSMWYKRNTFDTELIFKKCEFLNSNWLLSGQGSMLKDDIQESNVRATQVFRRRTDRLIDAQDIPLYDIQATAGLVSLLDNGKSIPIDTIRIPNLPKADGAIYVTGDSMYPLLKSGDIIIYKQIKDIPNEIFWGEMYIISMQVAGEEYVTVKYVQKSDMGDQFIKLVSQNQHHQPKDYPLKKVNAMALVKASIRFNTMK